MPLAVGGTLDTNTHSVSEMTEYLHTGIKISFVIKLASDLIALKIKLMNYICIELMFGTEDS